MSARAFAEHVLSSGQTFGTPALFVAGLRSLSTNDLEALLGTPGLAVTLASQPGLPDRIIGMLVRMGQALTVMQHTPLVPEVQDPLVRSSQVGVRRQAARSRYLTLDNVLLLATDPDPEVRDNLRDDLDLSVSALDTMAIYTDPQIRLVAARQRRLPGDRVRSLAASPEPAVRAAIAARPDLFDALDETSLVPLLADPHHPVVTALNGRNDIPPALRQHLCDDPVALAAHHDDPVLRLAAATWADAPGWIVATLAKDPVPTVRATVASRPDLTGELVTDLAGDPHDEVAAAASASPSLTATIAAELAASRSRRHRAAAAAAPALPPELADVLAHDRSKLVRAAIASRPDLPLLLQPPSLIDLAGDADADIATTVATHAVFLPAEAQALLALRGILEPLPAAA